MIFPFEFFSSNIVSNIFKVLTVKTSEWCLVLLLVTLIIFCTLIYCYYCWNQTNKCCLGLRNYSFRKEICFLVTVKNILSIGLGKFVGLNVFILIHLTCYERINFRNSSSKKPWLAYKSLLGRFSVLINYIM